MPLTPESLTDMERATLDAFNAIGMALARKLILGMNIQPDHEGEGGACIALFHPGEPATDRSDEGPVRVLRLTIPQHGTSFMGLLSVAGHHCHEMLCMESDADYLASQDEINKVRRNNRKRIMVPGAGRN